jgi:hypothetical protein
MMTQYSYNLFNTCSLLAICFVRINRAKGKSFERVSLCRVSPRKKMILSALSLLHIFHMDLFDCAVELERGLVAIVE